MGCCSSQYRELGGADSFYDASRMNLSRDQLVWWYNRHDTPLGVDYRKYFDSSTRLTWRMKVRLASFLVPEDAEIVIEVAENLHPLCILSWSELDTKFQRAFKKKLEEKARRLSDPICLEEVSPVESRDWFIASGVTTFYDHLDLLDEINDAICGRVSRDLWKQRKCAKTLLLCLRTGYAPKGGMAVFLKWASREKPANVWRMVRSRWPQEFIDAIPPMNPTRVVEIVIGQLNGPSMVSALRVLIPRMTDNPRNNNFISRICVGSRYKDLSRFLADWEMPEPPEYSKAGPSNGLVSVVVVEG